MKTRGAGIIACWGMLLASLTGRAASAETRVGEGAESERQIQVFQRKPFVRAMRFEVEPTFHVTLNDTMTRHVGAGVQARFHITDEWAIAAEYVKYWGWSTDLAQEIGEAYQVHPEKRLMDFHVGGHVQYSPIMGKFLWFGHLGRPVFWDFHLIVGGGAQKTLHGRYHGSGNFGAGVRFHWVPWLASNLEIRDYVFQENYAHQDKVVNNVVFTVGLAVFLPFQHRESR